MSKQEKAATGWLLFAERNMSQTADPQVGTGDVAVMSF
jgi:hypothetical protein